MDPQQIRERLDEIDRKLDRVMALTNQVETLLAAYMSSGGGRVLSALMKARIPR